jgi:hypothetical protein
MDRLTYMAYATEWTLSPYFKTPTILVPSILLYSACGTICLIKNKKLIDMQVYKKVVLKKD